MQLKVFYIPIKGACDKAISMHLQDINGLMARGTWCCGFSTRVLEESNPTLIGWKSLKPKKEFAKIKTPFHTDGRRFEIATSCILF